MTTEALVLSALALLVAGVWILDVLSNRTPPTRTQRLADQMKQAKAAAQGD
jgi:hypothetical protein